MNEYENIKNVQKPSSKGISNKVMQCGVTVASWQNIIFIIYHFKKKARSIMFFKG